MPLYCTKNHANQSGSSFCTSCGEVLWLSPGYVLASRYRIIQHLGHGGFGRTYLAEDLHRFNERCVLKQFAPQEQATSQLEKAKALFEREASTLYKLKHPQLPAFREFFTADLGKGAKGLFLAQDYIEGKTYSDLPKPLSEAEVINLISQLLPVLTYLHSQGTIHRDISPDNLILRREDRKPVLIDFGGVKQLVTASLNQGQVLTKLGKQGYAPEEQLKLGEVSPSSDLYGLAVTAIVLLTGKEPDQLYDSYKGTWHWRKEIKVSSNLEKVLQKMLSYKQCDRYQWALDVAKALKLPDNQPETANISHIATVNVVGQKNLPTPPSHPQGNTQVLVATPSFGWLKPIALKIVGASLVVFVVINALPLLSSLKSLVPVVTPITVTVTEAQVANLVRRRQALKVTSRFFNTTVNEAFYQKHPELNRRSLKPAPEDADLRTDWYNIADDLLNKLDSLTPEARIKLGNYSKSNRHTLQAEIDRQFYQWFPHMQGKKLNPNTYGQIWEAIAFDKIRQLERR
ncbi:MAG: protein kinase [Chroococcus sp. CMT-3BRIN-NPC107]|jgi:serine/threonine-protein kinase|nr:protein kinase [Chroococcus sp. CMT-3BRIN-NPC107]